MSVEISAAASVVRPLPRRLMGAGVTRVALTLFDQAIVSLATFVTGVMISRSTQAGFGMYALVLTLWVLAGEVQNSLVHTPHMLRLPKLDARRALRFNGSLLLHQLGLNGLLTLALLAISGVLFLGERGSSVEGDDYALITLMTAVSLAPVALRNFARSVCFAGRHAMAALILDSSVAALQVGGVAILMVNGLIGEHWWAAVLVIAGANLLSATVWLLTWRDRFRAGVRRARLEFGRTWRTGRMVLVSSMLWVVGGQAYPWMVSVIAGHAAAGVWGACVALASLANPLLMGVQNFMGPAIAHAHADRSPAEFRRYVLKCVAVFAAIVLPPSVAFAAMANALLRHINGEEYAGHGMACAMLGLALVFQSVSFPTSRALFSLGRAGLDTLANVGPIIVLLGLGATLVRSHGVHGAALSFLIAQVVSAGLHLAAFLYVSRPETQRESGFPLPTLCKENA